MHGPIMSSLRDKRARWRNCYLLGYFSESAADSAVKFAVAEVYTCTQEFSIESV